MGLFDIFKGKKENKKNEKKRNKEKEQELGLGEELGEELVQEIGEEITEEEKFLQEVSLALEKYFGELKIEFNLKDENGEPTDFIKKFPDVYATCMKINSPWDRRSIIFRKLDDMFGKEIEFYTYAERLIEDRYAKNALEILENNPEPEKYKDRYYKTYAKALMICGDYEKALEMIMKGLEENPECLKSKVLKADILYYIGKSEEAYEIYDPLLAEYMNDVNNKTGLVINELFGEKIPSPILAIEFLKKNNLNDDIWKWAEDEFYYSPYFRLQHSYWILKEKKELLKGFSKLLALTKEMPWIKEAAINTMALFEKIDPNAEKGIVLQDRKKVQEIIKKNGWDLEGLYNLDIEL